MLLLIKSIKICSSIEYIVYIVINQLERMLRKSVVCDRGIDLFLACRPHVFGQI